MRRLLMRLEGAFVVVDLVQHDLRLILRIGQHVELPAARLLARLARVVERELHEALDVFGLDADVHDQDEHGSLLWLPTIARRALLRLANLGEELDQELHARAGLRGDGGELDTAEVALTVLAALLHATIEVGSAMVDERQIDADLDLLRRR